MESIKIVVVGEIRQDIYLSQISGFELEYSAENKAYNKLWLDQELFAKRIEATIGGSAANVATALARWGVEPIVLSQLGTDWLGNHLLQNLDSENINTNFINLESSVSTNCAFRFYDRGLIRQSVVSYKEPFGNIDLDKINFKGVDWLFCSSMLGNFDLLDRIFRKATDAGVKIMFNPGLEEIKNMKKTWGLLEDVEVLLVNREEAIKMLKEPALEEAVRKLTAFVPLAIITDSEEGLIASDRKSIWRAGVYQPAQIIDRTGVGDAFASGFLFKYAQSGDIAKAVTHGSANAASVVSQLGAQAGILKLNEDPAPMLVREKAV